MQGRFDYLRQERVSFGTPLLDALPAYLAEVNKKRVFLITSRSLNRSTGTIAAFRDRLGADCVGFHDDAQPQTPRASVVALADRIRAAEPDILVTIGGGTAIDAGKMSLLCLAEAITDPADLDAFRVRVDASGGRQVPAVRPSPIRQIVAPTTLSCAEFSQASGCTDPARRTKDIYSFPDMCAQAVFLDPELALHTPLRLWLATGMKAVDHAAEALCSRTAHPFSDALAERALALLAEGLRAVHAAPDMAAPRLTCQLGAWMAGFVAGQVESGASHGISHQLGAVAGVPHGETSCVMLPAVLGYNAVANAGRQAMISSALGVPELPAAEAIAGLVAALGLPATLEDVGVTPAHWPAIVAGAMENHMVRSNPRPIVSAQQIEDILTLASRERGAKGPQFALDAARIEGIAR